MSQVPNQLRYARSHEWARVESNGEVTVGITEHAQHLLGDLVFVELPALKQIQAGSETGVVESVKAASDVYAPISGTIVAVNENLSSDPGVVNRDPYGDGWLFRINPSNKTEIDELLDAANYTTLINS